MINANADAMGIIFPNNYDKFVPELVSERLMASIPFASRYRMIDFLLSSMVGCGIDKIEVLVRENYHSLVDHLGGGESGISAVRTEDLVSFLHLPRSLSAVWEEEEWKRSPIFFRYSKSKKKNM